MSACESMQAQIGRHHTQRETAMNDQGSSGSMYEFVLESCRQLRVATISRASSRGTPNWLDSSVKQPGWQGTCDEAMKFALAR